MASIAYLGPEGSFSSFAAMEVAEPGDVICGYDKFYKIFESVAAHETDSAIVPIENTIKGMINDNLDLIRNYPLSITAEHYLPVEQSLVVLNEEVKIENIRTILSYDHALDQCREFFRRHVEISFVEEIVASTGAAAREVMERDDPSVAAIASTRAAPLFGLTVLEQGVQDVKNSFTRFVKVEPTNDDTLLPPEANKCSVLLDLPHRPGALLNTIKILTEHEHNIMTVMTRPIPNRLWEYLFYVDFISENGHDNIELSVAALKRFCNDCRVLGIYENKSPMPWLSVSDTAGEGAANSLPKVS